MKSTVSWTNVCTLFTASLVLHGCSRFEADSSGGELRIQSAESQTLGPVSEQVTSKVTTVADSEAPQVDATSLLTRTLEQAQANQKCVFVHLGAPWCGWCTKLESFLDEHSQLFTDDFILLKIDVETMKGGAEVAHQLRGERTGGIPWITILDATGTEIISSDGPDGNIGCPVTAEEQAYFVSMIEKSMQHSPASRLAEITEALKEFSTK